MTEKENVAVMEEREKMIRLHHSETVNELLS
jgi:hypothetical protein